MDEIVVEYFPLAAALGRALDSDSPEFWQVVAELQVAFPSLDWKNAMTDGHLKVERLTITTRRLCVEHVGQYDYEAMRDQDCQLDFVRAAWRKGFGVVTLPEIGPMQPIPGVYHVANVDVSGDVVRVRPAQ